LPRRNRVPSRRNDQELSRITVLVGEQLIETGLPSRVSISAVVGDIIEMASDRAGCRKP